MSFAQHPLSAAFPTMSAEESQSLKDSIMSIGVQNPITIFEGMVIDGWHRYIAANELGMDCPMVELGDVDPRDFVVAQNKARRHITKAQLIASASAVYRWRPNGGDHSALSAECISSKALADKVGAGVRSVEQYRHIEREAAPDVVNAVKRGEIGLPKAAAIAKLPKEEQAAAIVRPAPKHKPSAEQTEDEEYTEADALRDQISDLRIEIARLKLLVPEEADEGNEMLEDLRREITLLKKANKAITESRDRLQAENAELKKQCAWMKKKLKG